MSHSLKTDTRLTREQLLARRSSPVHIVGAASAEGVAVARLLLGLDFDDIVVHDMRERDVLRRAFRTTHGAYGRVEQDEIWEALTPVLDRGRFGDDYLTGIAGDAAPLIVLGQGWYLGADNREHIIETVNAAPGALLTSMSELYFALAPGPIAGLTGTNGKSTTVALVEALLEAADVTHHSAGNERSSRQFLSLIESLPRGDWSLLEISNRQLLQVNRSPAVAAMTSLTPDHLAEHEGGFAGYALTKARIFSGQRTGDIAITNADSDMCLEAALSSSGTLVRCGIGRHRGPSVAWVDDELVATDVPRYDAADLGDGRGPASLAGEHVLATRDDVTIPGDHNLRNIAIAAAVALAMGADPATVAPALRAFAGKALRLQRLETIDGVEIWSDIKSTTPEATLAALAALGDRRVHIVLGGDDKGLDYRSLAGYLAHFDGTAHSVPGSATDALVRELAGAGASEQLRSCGDLPEAFDAALAAAGSGDAVIVSPAAAGFWTRELDGKTSLRTLVRSRASASSVHIEET